MPLHMLKETQPRSIVGGIRCRRLFSHQDEGEAILDYQELVGRDLGREWLLQDLQRPQRLRSRFHGFYCCCCSRQLTVGHESNLCWRIFVYSWGFRRDVFEFQAVIFSILSIGVEVSWKFPMLSVPEDRIVFIYGVKTC